MNRTILLGLLTSCLFVSACGSPTTNTGTNTPKTGTQVKTNAKTFRSPTAIQAPTIASDSPGQLWNFPNDPAKVIRNIHKWLSTATVTTVNLPKTNQNLTFNAYIGPAELYFVDQAGDRILVEPAYYLAHDSNGYHPALVKNVVLYKDDKNKTYLKSPSLFNWLATDKNWEADFRIESSTKAGQTAITDAKKSKWGGNFTDIFPALPGIDTHGIQHTGTVETRSIRRDRTKRSRLSKSGTMVHTSISGSTKCLPRELSSLIRNLAIRSRGLSKLWDDKRLALKWSFPRFHYWGREPCPFR